MSTTTDGCDRPLRARFDALFGALAGIGRLPGGAGGWTRLAWTAEDAAARAWFADQSRRLGLAVETDRNGNQWAWWGDRGGRDAVVTGSHLDTVPSGGAFDGALGVVSGLLAVDELQRRELVLSRPVAVAALADEEGGRFNTPTFGTRLATGLLDPADVRDRRDADGVSLYDAVAAAGLDPGGLGPDPQRLARIGAFVELHVEQGRGLADLGQPLALGSGIWPHGRWRLAVDGEPNHAGTTRLEDRLDPTLVLATAIAAARDVAAAHGGVATVGRIEVSPNASNGVAGRVDAWLDARATDDDGLDRLLTGWVDAVAAAAAVHGRAHEVTQESRTPGVMFDTSLGDHLRRRLESDGATVPALPTAAGHDAGILAAQVPTAMLFVRNPTGASHTPAEHAGPDDCVAGIRALAAILEELACA